MTEPRLAAALIRLNADLRTIEARWALIGGLAVSARAEPRTTRDIDVTVAVTDDREAEKTVHRMTSLGYVIDTHLEQEATDRLSTVRLLMPGDHSGILADLLFASSGIEAEVAAEADLYEVIPGLFVPLAKTGHLLALKVLALRPDRPQDLVLVDDAHLDPEKLTRLRQIRANIGAKFAIVASAWPHAENEVANALEGIGSGNIRKLEGLTRAEIVQVLRAIGVSEQDDDPYLILLVDQSANKPGLAVTLGSLWLRGEGHDILTGKVLQRSLIPALKQVLEHDPTRLLACFALGGDRGMSMETVGDFLEVGREEIHRRASLASQGGLLSVHRDQLLSVQPEALRSALLAEVFFTPPALRYRPLLDRAPERQDAIETLAMAALREVDVPGEELRDLLLEAGSLRTWQMFAVLGENEGQWVLEHFPAEIEKVTPSLLRSAPRQTIRRLLDDAECAEGPLHSHISHPLRLLQDWVAILDSRHYPGQIGEILERRRILVEEATGYLRRGGDPSVGLRACFLTLSSTLYFSGSTASGGMTKGEIWLPTSSIPQILEFWTESCKELGELTLESWSDLQEVLQGWVWPNILGRELTEEEIDRRRDVARRIVSSLVEKAQEHPGLALALKSWADLMEFSLTLPEDEGFSVIFPLTDHLSPENWEEEEEKRRQAARALATNWARRPEKDVVRLLARFAAEARTFGTQESQATSEFFLMLASQVEAPEEWLNEFLAERLPASWVNPILERVVRHRHRGWEKILELLLENDEYSWLAGGVTIRSEGIPRSLLDTALARIPDNLVETACHRKQVPLDTLKSLLGHEREEIAVAAAVGEWLSEPRGEVRPQIRAEWRAALIRLGSAGNVERSRPGQSYWLREILSSDPDLAAARLEARSRR